MLASVSAPLDLSLAVLGYQRAVGRFVGAGDRLRDLNVRLFQHFEDPTEPSPLDDDISVSGYYISLSEALNWAVTLDRRYQQVWPEGDPKSWWSPFDGGASVRGLRYARNCVSHDWTEAIAMPEDRRDQKPRAMFIHWKWTWPLPARKPDPEGEGFYRDHLVGEPVAISLPRMAVVFIEGLNRLAELVCENPTVLARMAQVPAKLAYEVITAAHHRSAAIREIARPLVGVSSPVDRPLNLGTLVRYEHSPSVSDRHWMSVVRPQ
jgi:hypothetical protein